MEADGQMEMPAEMPAAPGPVSSMAASHRWYTLGRGETCMSMQDREGDFVWYPLMTDNADAAQEFYGSLLGWDFTSGDAPGIDYRLGSMTDTEVVGVLQLTPEMHEGGARPAWIGYIAVTAIDDALTRLEELGGRVLMGPDHMEGVGHMAMVLPTRRGRHST